MPAGSPRRKPSPPTCAAPVVKPGITVSAPTVPQTWTDGQNADLVLPANTFTDALGLKMSFAAYELSGPNITSWLRFNPATDEFAGKVPANASGTAWLAVVASDAQHMSAVDMFPVTFVSGTAHVGRHDVCGGAKLRAAEPCQRPAVPFMRATRRTAG